ncbi:protein SRC2-like [Actinidia eriantha]|uniref:protein SRC2-like n=1 Tax=Actinidia eriantha TaxID=165200 RepID=UPI00258FB64C|nr:protein SRC2-like [Actinidia eriantha]
MVSGNMEYRPLDITVISAENLKDVNLISKMDVYVEVSIGGDPVGKQKTHVDKDGGKSPKWNHRLKFDVGVGILAANPALPIHFKIRSDRPLGDKDIGDVSVPIEELLLEADGDERVVEYQVRTPSGKPKGTFKFSYKFGDNLASPAEPPPPPPKPENTGGEAVTAYPAHPGPDAAYLLPAHVGYAQPHPGYGAPPPAPGYGYPAPGYGAPPLAPGYGYPAPGYGYPPVQPGYGALPPAPGYGYPAPGYGYPPVQEAVHKPTKKINFGLALAAAGLLEGVLMGDMAGLGDF